MLVGGAAKRQSVGLIEAALDAGIRHFDIAPNYGLGQAENLLGDVLRSRRDSVTITTKVGIARPMGGVGLSIIRSVARTILRRSVLTKRMSANVGARLVGRRIALSSDVLSKSVLDSLRRLRTDRVDVLLLHEVLPEEVPTEVFDKLECMKARGTIGSYGFGIAGTPEYPPPNQGFGEVQQHSFSLGNAICDNSGKFIITHRAILNNQTKLELFARSDVNEASELSKKIDFDIFDREKTGDLLIAAAMSANERGIVLFSTRNLHRLSRYGKISTDNRLMASGAMLNRIWSLI